MDTCLYIKGNEYMAVTIFKELWMEQEKAIEIKDSRIRSGKMVG